MSMKLRWGILGTGNIARQFAPAMAESRRGELVAVGSRASAAASDFASAFGLRQAFGSYNDLLAEPGIDAMTLYSMTFCPEKFMLQFPDLRTSDRNRPKE